MLGNMVSWVRQQYSLHCFICQIRDTSTLCNSAKGISRLAIRDSICDPDL